MGMRNTKTRKGGWYTLPTTNGAKSKCLYALPTNNMILPTLVEPLPTRVTTLPRQQSQRDNNLWCIKWHKRWKLSMKMELIWSYSFQNHLMVKILNFIWIPFLRISNNHNIPYINASLRHLIEHLAGICDFTDACIRCYEPFVNASDSWARQALEAWWRWWK